MTENDNFVDIDELNNLSEELNSLIDAKNILLEEIESTKNEINFLTKYKSLVLDHQRNKKLFVGNEYIDLGSRNNIKYFRSSFRR